MQRNKRFDVRWTALVAVIVTLGFIPISGAASAPAEDPKTQMLDRHLEEVPHGDVVDENVDWEETELLTHEFTLPKDASYAFSIDWETGDVEVDILEQPLAAHGEIVPLAGCLSNGLDNPNAMPGVGINNCTGEAPEIDGAITNTTVICSTDGISCETDAHPTDWSGYVFIGCASQHVDRYAWPGATPLLGAQECQIVLFGDSPASWESYVGASCGRTVDASETTSLTGCIHE